MKTYQNLYPQIYSFQNLYFAFREARKAKRERVAVGVLRATSDKRQPPQPTLERPTYPPSCNTPHT